MTHFDAVVLGSGPGGYVAALKAAQKGMRTAIVEQQWWGGVDAAVGAVPLASLLRSADIADAFVHHKDEFGIAGEVHLDFAAAIKRSREAAEQVTKSVALLLRKNKVTQYFGAGTFRDAKTLSVSQHNGITETLTFDHCVLATGGSPKMLPWVNKGSRVMTSREIMSCESLPSSIAVCGAGPVGVEFAWLFAAYGAEVTLVEYADRILPAEDPEVSSEVTKAFKGLGVRIMPGFDVKGVVENADRAAVYVAPRLGGQEVRLEAETVLLTVGCVPNTSGYGLETTGVALSSDGSVEVGENMATSVEGIWAVGDVTGGRMMTAQSASAQALIAVASMVGESAPLFDAKLMPHVIHCQPQVASFGLTGGKAQALGHQVKVSKFPFTANSAAAGLGYTNGFVKIVADTRHNEIIGAHMVGPGVAELLPELVLAAQWDLTTDEIALTIHAHPTLSEAVREAAEGVGGRMTNF
ncbi:MAG: dihydrolipoyl dehydrogenase [Propionibacteriaceae bacterium]|jgi:dihydrolipoamide dehydrogenase|nr:dihydrolipoyl dehydrogenase [Propionibacteriaceae bacterium]